jgi:hypothetical protein
VSDEESDHIVVVREINDEASGRTHWDPKLRFSEVRHARHWLKHQAQHGATYHILAFRDEDVLVQAPAPVIATNVLAVGKQHTERGPRTARDTSSAEDGGAYTPDEAA